jgi:uncharacterized protein (DUF111 family)
MKKLIINPQYGMSGDMLSAALLSLGAPKAAMLDAMAEAARPVGGAHIEVMETIRLDKSGIKLEIKLQGSEPDIDASELFTHLEEALVTIGIKDYYYDFVLRAFDILSHAEYEAHTIHGHHKHVTHDEELHGVHLHEAKDIVIDLVGAAIGMQELDIDVENVTCLTPVVVGGGTVRFSHGEVDVPAPATASIIKSYEVPTEAGPIKKELFTPTGASILASLNPHYETREKFFAATQPNMTIGTGFGSLDLSKEYKSPNALFIYLLDSNI